MSKETEKKLEELAAKFNGNLKISVVREKKAFKVFQGGDLIGEYVKGEEDSLRDLIEKVTENVKAKTSNYYIEKLELELPGLAKELEDKINRNNRSIMRQAYEAGRRSKKFLGLF